VHLAHWCFRHCSGKRFRDFVRRFRGGASGALPAALRYLVVIGEHDLLCSECDSDAQNEDIDRGHRVGMCSTTTAPPTAAERFHLRVEQQQHQQQRPQQPQRNATNRGSLKGMSCTPSTVSSPRLQSPQLNRLPCSGTQSPQLNPRPRRRPRPLFRGDAISLSSQGSPLPRLNPRSPAPLLPSRGGEGVLPSTWRPFCEMDVHARKPPKSESASCETAEEQVYDTVLDHCGSLPYTIV
jgi:hypothetical protein